MNSKDWWHREFETMLLSLNFDAAALMPDNPLEALFPCCTLSYWTKIFIIAALLILTSKSTQTVYKNIISTGLPSDLSAKERELAQRERAVTLQEFAVKKQGRDIELEVEITAHQELTRMFQKKALCHQETVIAITSVLFEKFTEQSDRSMGSTQAQSLDVEELSDLASPASFPTVTTPPNLAPRSRSNPILYQAFDLFRRVIQVLQSPDGTIRLRIERIVIDRFVVHGILILFLLTGKLLGWIYDVTTAALGTDPGDIVVNITFVICAGIVSFNFPPGWKQVVDGPGISDGERIREWNIGLSRAYYVLVDVMSYAVAKPSSTLATARSIAAFSIAVQVNWRLSDTRIDITASFWGIYEPRISFGEIALERKKQSEPQGLIDQEDVVHTINESNEVETPEDLSFAFVNSVARPLSKIWVSCGSLSFLNEQTECHVVPKAEEEKEYYEDKLGATYYTERRTDRISS
ncbi:MAG: hypothetical protein NXY57DRAFT_1041031 [Lentinula lateritia]|nr:MAG: hypothetical protein NXY57DRAFT_1041031 [Lentinula lateritia]